MTEKNDEAPAEERVLEETAPNVEEDMSLSQENPRDVDTRNENQMPSQQQEEEIIKKKYGGLLSKKPPLISKDHERAFFDSADWALGKKGKGPLEALRPKLEPTPHHQVRARSPCAPADEAEENNGESNGLSPSESQNHSPVDQNL